MVYITYVVMLKDSCSTEYDFMVPGLYPVVGCFGASHELHVNSSKGTLTSSFGKVPYCNTIEYRQGYHNVSHLIINILLLGSD